MSVYNVISYSNVTRDDKKQRHQTINIDGAMQKIPVKFTLTNIHLLHNYQQSGNNNRSLKILR